MTADQEAALVNTAPPTGVALLDLYATALADADADIRCVQHAIEALAGRLSRTASGTRRMQLEAGDARLRELRASFEVERDAIRAERDAALRPGLALADAPCSRCDEMDGARVEGDAA